MTKKLLFPFILLSVFLFGCLGHRLTEPPRTQETPYSLTFCAENVNNLLLYELPKEGEVIRFGDTNSTVLKVTYIPHKLYARKDGALLSGDSLLLSDVTFTLSARAHEKNGRLMLRERSRPIGEEITLCGENFSLRARFSDFSAEF